MVGAFSDNQPDYSWIKPLRSEDRSSSTGIRSASIGGFKNANLNGAVNLELRPDLVASVGVCTTSRRPGSRLVVKSKQDVLCEETVDIAPGQPLLREIRVPAGTRESDLQVALFGKRRQAVDFLSTCGKTAGRQELPKPVAPPTKPEDISSVEELYLTGLRIEQIHNPSVDPRDYYREAFKRDPDDTRCNTMIGIHASDAGSRKRRRRTCDGPSIG